MVVVIPTSITARAFNDIEEREVTGHLFIFDPATGGHVSFSRRHVEDPDAVHSVRLELRSEGKTIDMVLKQDSVWTKDSKVVVRSADDVLEEASVDIDAACYLSGDVSSDEDAFASFNICDDVSGMIHTREAGYAVLWLSSSVDYLNRVE